MNAILYSIYISISKHMIENLASYTKILTKNQFNNFSEKSLK